MIEILKVSKSFDKKPVLTDVDLRFAQGQTHVLLGSSGCGKSTLLRLIMGLLPIDSGKIIVDGAEVRFPPSSQAAQRIGYVIQDGGLFPHMTARQNVTLVSRTLGWKPEKVNTRFSLLSTLVEIDEKILNRHPGELSGGQRQRVGLMRALMLDPPVLLLDEPLGALDPIVRASLQDELKKTFNKVKKTVILVTHDIGEAAFFGHTVTLMNEGRVVQKGSFTEFLEKPASPFVHEFIRAQRPPPELKAFL